MSEPRLTRFDWERRIKSSDLPPLARLVGFTLATHTSKGGLGIPQQFAPSLSQLASETGASEATVKRMLRVLDEQGWVARLQPSAHAARVEKKRTTYTLTFPAGLSQSPALGSQGAQLDEVAGLPQSPGRAPTEPRAGLPQSHSSKVVSKDPKTSSLDACADDRTSVTAQSSMTEEGGEVLADVNDEPLQWARDVIRELDFGQGRKRPSAKQAQELASLVAAARDIHGLSEVEIVRHCRLTLREATSNAVAYLRNGLADHLPEPAPRVEELAEQDAPEPLPPPKLVVSSDDITADEWLARGLKGKFIPTRLRSVTQEPKESA